jgi:hypothetical protein
MDYLIRNRLRAGFNCARRKHAARGLRLKRLLIRKLLDYYHVIIMRAFMSWKHNRFTIDQYMA